MHNCKAPYNWTTFKITKPKWESQSRKRKNLQIVSAFDLFQWVQTGEFGEKTIFYLKISWLVLPLWQPHWKCLRCFRFWISFRFEWNSSTAYYAKNICDGQLLWFYNSSDSTTGCSKDLKRIYSTVLALSRTWSIAASIRFLRPFLKWNSNAVDLVNNIYLTARLNLSLGTKKSL